MRLIKNEDFIKGKLIVIEKATGNEISLYLFERTPSGRCLYCSILRNPMGINLINKEYKLKGEK